MGDVRGGAAVIDPNTTNGTPGLAQVTYGVLKDPSESNGVEVLPQSSGGVLVVAQGKMDGWSLWRTKDTSASRVVGDTILVQVRYALSREGLFDADR